MTDAELDQCRHDAALLHSVVSRSVMLTRDGRRWKGCCPLHLEKTPSFTLFGDGKFKCFGCDASGSVFDYVMATEHIDFPAAIKRIEAERGIAPSQPNASRRVDHDDTWQPIVPPPADAPQPSQQQLQCDVLFEYPAANDRLLCYVRRFEAKNGKRKQFFPLTYGVLNGQRGWHDKAPQTPRPLYGLNRLSHAVPDATVILVEGEKAADAAQRLFLDYVCMSWMGGASADASADLSPLQGRSVILWPDADQPGHEVMARIAKRLTQVRLIDTTGMPDGYDAANLEGEGCDDPDAWLTARLREPASPTEPGSAPDSDDAATKPVLHLRYGFDATAAQPLGTVVEGVLHAGSVTLIFGPPKSGKSFLATDLALAIPHETRDEWMGHTIVRHGPVLYVACEGHAGFWKRLSAATKARGWDRETFPKGFILATGRPMLIRADARGMTYAPDPSSIIEALEDAKRRGLDPVGIVIDTVFRSFGDGNVNASPDMNVYLACVAVLTDGGYAVALVHHEIKSGGTPAGSVSLTGGADTVVHVWRETGERRLWQVEMAKDDAETEPRAFTLAVVQIGLDPDGRPASSCVVSDGGAAPEAAARKRGRPPSDNSDAAILADLIYRELCNLLANPNEGQDVSLHPESPAIRAVSRTRLRGTINQAGILDPLPDGADRKRVIEKNNAQVKRSINRLKKQHKVAVNEQWIGLV
jgi:hypothetical protein